MCCQVRGNNPVNVLMNDRYVTNVLPRTRIVGRVGVLASNGYNTTLLFRGPRLVPKNFTYGRLYQSLYILSYVNWTVSIFVIDGCRHLASGCTAKCGCIV